MDDPAMDSCIETCNHCHQTCLRSAMTMCLETGGKHVEPAHFRLMLNCAEMCQTATNFMLSRSSVHDVVCAACAEVCAACADSCAELDGMEACTEACRRCADECRSMGGAANT